LTGRECSLAGKRGGESFAKKSREVAVREKRERKRARKAEWAASNVQPVAPELQREPSLPPAEGVPSVTEAGISDL
jgi:hypothetical protein